MRVSGRGVGEAMIHVPVRHQQSPIATRTTFLLGVAGLLCAACSWVPSDAHAQVKNRGTIPLALTLDDLPFVGPTVRGETPVAALERIAAVLKAQRVPASGFVVCSRLKDAPESLSKWTAAGLALGNHSDTHRSLNKVDVSAWLADAARCQAALDKHNAAPVRYFRYPYLQTGATAAARDRAARGLRKLGLVRAPVSIDTADWVLATPYAQAKNSGDEALAHDIASAYLGHIRLAARHYRAAARAQTGREVAQVLLLHANALFADLGDQVLALLREEGFHFVTLDQALADPIYRRKDTWVSAIGASWLYRVAPGQDQERAWLWDSGQQRALEVRFALAADGPGDIGPDLQLKPLAGLQGARAWLITHQRPLPANSLLVVGPRGTPVLADTPWTPQATRDLLDWIITRFGRPPALATVSHYHLDAAGGISTLAAEGVPAVGVSLTAALTRTRGAAMQAQLAREHGAAFEGWALAAPTRTFEPDKVFRSDVDGLTVEVRYPGPGHSSDNVVTWFPDQQLLFGGCLIKGGDSIGYLGDADLQHYGQTLDRVRALGARVVVSGHGPRTDPGQIEHTRRLWAAELAR